MKAKALDIIISFTKEEKKRFADFLQSGYFTKNKAIVKLYNIVSSGKENSEDKSGSGEEVYNKVFKKNGYSYNTLRNLLSKLNELAETFIVIERVTKDDLEKHKLLNDELIKRNLFTLLANNHTKSIKALDQQEKRNNMYYYYKFHYDSAALRSSYSSKPESFVYNDRLNSVLESFSKWICLNALEFYQGIFGLQASHNLKLDENNNNFFDTILKYSGKAFAADGLIQTYLYYYEITSSITTNYYGYRESIFRSLEKFDFWEQRAFLIVACNYTIDRIEEGKKEFYDDFHRYMKLMIEKKYVFTITGFLSENAFTLSIKNYCHEGKIPEAEKFFERHKEELVPELKESVLNLCSAIILFYKKDYNTALKFLNRIRHEYYALVFQANNLNLILLYETERIENIDIIINSSLKYISSNKDAAPFLKNHYKNFIVIFKKLIRIKLGENDDVHSLKIELEKMNRCHFKGWLMEKISGFENKK